MARREKVIVVGVVAALVAAGVVLAITAAPPSVNVAVPIGAAVVAGAVVVVVVVIIAMRRARKPKQAEAPAGLAWAPTITTDLHKKFGPLPGIPTSGSTKRVLHGEIDGRALTIFEHVYVVHTGHAVIPVTHTAYVTGAPAWPAVTITPRGTFGRLMRRLGIRRGLELEEETFNDSCRVRSKDDEFALTLLGPEMQRFLALNKGCTWHVHAGCCALIESGTIDPARIEASVERLRQFWSHVPDELSEWA